MENLFLHNDHLKNKQLGTCWGAAEGLTYLLANIFYIYMYRAIYNSNSGDYNCCNPILDHQVFLKCYFISIIIYKNPKK